LFSKGWKLMWKSNQQKKHAPFLMGKSTSWPINVSRLCKPCLPCYLFKDWSLVCFYVYVFCSFFEKTPWANKLTETMEIKGLKILWNVKTWWVFIDAPPTPLTDSIVSPKGENNRRTKSWAHSLSHNILEVEGRARVPRWGLGRVTSKSITHTDLHKPNNKLISA
jgi:hypothetical protein